LAQPYEQPRQNFCEFRKLPHHKRVEIDHIANNTMLYLVGLGLADEKDVTVKGLEIIKKAERVYLEAYTAVLLVEKDVLVRGRQPC
jgi:hypothetical protein